MTGQNPAAVADVYARFKQEAGEYAVGFVESGMVVGWGTGSTAIHAGRRLPNSRLRSGERMRVERVRLITASPDGVNAYDPRYGKADLFDPGTQGFVTVKFLF